MRFLKKDLNTKKHYILRMPNYSDSKIYKIVCNTSGNIYIGSTTQQLCARLSQHVANYKDFVNGNRTNVTSFDVIKNKNYDMVLIESVQCGSKEELHRRERHFIETLKCVNKCIPLRTDEEYYEANKDKIKEREKKYRDSNKDKIKDRKKEYYEANKDKKKEYYEANKDKIKEREKEYRKENKEKIKERNKERYEANKVLKKD